MCPSLGRQWTWAFWGTLFFAALAIGPLTSAAPGNEKGANDTVHRLLDQARQAEVEGDTARQFALLRQAVRVAPDYELARWQLGQLKVGDAWVAVEESQRAAAANPKQAEYGRLRAQYGESLDGQLALARWCRKNGLDEESRLHWASVLAVQPGNEEALRALGMWMYDGRPMTPADIANAKQQVREAKRAAEQWEPMVAKWRRAVSQPIVATRDAALEEIRALSAVDAIPALEAVTLGRDAVDKHQSNDCRKISLAFVEALSAMPAQAATESLVRHAVLSPSPDVRTAATEKLKGRPLHEFVPLLLDALAMPIESSFNVVANNDGSVHYYHSLYREGQNGDWSANLRRSVVQHDLAGPAYTYDVKTDTLEVAPPKESPAVTAMKQQRVAANYEKRYARAVVATQARVGQANQAIEALNARIIPVLEGATGKEFGDMPKAWWNWWRDQNEYYASGDGLEYAYYDTGTDYYGYRPPTMDVRYPQEPRYRGPMSCFAKGTLVWTKTGQQPIETLELGDLVLAQDVNTGELAYKPVIGRTVRPPSPIVKLSFDGEQILTTRGHLFWVAGVGWRMAKELGDGAILHGVTGSTRIGAVKEVEPAEAYNLVVADFNTYFVGDQGLLVHDNTPRRPTLSSVPGLAATK